MDYLFMKLFSLFALSFFVIGCSTTPRVGDISGANYPVKIEANSSDGLKAIASTSITGVRDVTQSEIDDVRGDLDKFEKLVEARKEGLDPNLYAGISGATGVALGLSLDYAAGVAILGRLAADNRVRNYEFSDDFRSNHVLYSTMASNSLLEHFNTSIPLAMERFNDTASKLFGISIDNDPIVISVKKGDGYNGSAPFERYAYEYVGVVSKPIEGRNVSSMFHFSARCDDDLKGGSLCETNVRFLVNKKANPAVSLLAKEISLALPEGSVLYMPPRKDLYQFPMVYGTSGEPMILIQSEQ
jgi:hypothetical protein